jgi:hypothetical protein
VDDVFGHVVLAVGDEDLGAEDFVGAIALRLGAGAHGGQVGPACGSVRFMVPVHLPVTSGSR